MNEAFLRNYRKILTALLILLLIPLTVACFYDRPLGDELIQSLDAARAWRESGSLLQTFQKAFQMMARDYQTRSGIFFSMLLFAMPLSVFGGNWLVGVNALLTILLMLYGFWRVAGCLQSLCRGVSQEAVRCAGLLLGLMALLLLPDYHESIYWFGGAINYTVMSALAMLLFSAVFRAALDGKAPVWRLCLWCVGFFCLGGTNWMTPASSIVLYGAIAVWVLITRRPKRLLLPYLFLLLGFATAALAPGNAARQETMNANVSFISAFLSSFQHSVLYFFSLPRPSASRQPPCSRCCTSAAIGLHGTQTCVFSCCASFCRSTVSGCWAGFCAGRAMSRKPRRTPPPKTAAPSLAWAPRCFS